VARGALAGLLWGCYPGTDHRRPSRDRSLDLNNAGDGRVRVLTDACAGRARSAALVLLARLGLNTIRLVKAAMAEASKQATSPKRQQLRNVMT
jgi:hypothetical protein